jgi:hypothetical protein
MTILDEVKPFEVGKVVELVKAGLIAVIVDELFGKKEGGRTALARVAENFGQLNLKFFKFGFSYMFMLLF